MYRDDIFYDGSIVNLPTYEKSSKMIKSGSAQQSAVRELFLYVESDVIRRISFVISFLFYFQTIQSSLMYHMSVSRLPTQRDVQEETDKKCYLFPESMTRALKTMFDFHVVKYPFFVLFTISTCFLAVGINVPNYFTYGRRFRNFSIP